MQTIFYLNVSGHDKFDLVRNVSVVLYSANDQMEGKPAYETTIGEAVDGVSSNFTIFLSK